MCSVPPSTTVRPRWGALYARILVAAALGAAIAAAPLSPGWQLILGLAVTLAAGVAALRWIRANAPALDQSAWCDCAGREITVRVIRSDVPARPPGRRVIQPAPAGADWRMPVP